MRNSTVPHLPYEMTWSFNVLPNNSWNRTFHILKYGKSTQSLQMWCSKTDPLDARLREWIENCIYNQAARQGLTNVLQTSPEFSVSLAQCGFFRVREHSVVIRPFKRSTFFLLRHWGFGHRRHGWHARGDDYWLHGTSFLTWAVPAVWWRSFGETCWNYG